MLLQVGPQGLDIYICGLGTPLRFCSCLSPLPSPTVRSYLGTLLTPTRFRSTYEMAVTHDGVAAAEKAQGEHVDRVTTSNDSNNGKMGSDGGMCPVRFSRCLQLI